MIEETNASEPRLTTRGDSLFMLAYRCWHAGFDYGDAECWQYAWTALSNALGPREARPVLGAIEDFVRTLRAVARRRLDYYPPPCCRMSDSEQRVIDLIAALQAGAPGAEDLIEDLCGALTEDAGRLVLAHGSTLASRLRDVGITMQPQGAALPRRSLH
jgi:hypothetical protein